MVHTKSGILQPERIIGALMCSYTIGKRSPARVYMRLWKAGLLIQPGSEAFSHAIQSYSLTFDPVKSSSQRMIRTVTTQKFNPLFPPKKCHQHRLREKLLGNVPQATTLLKIHRKPAIPLLAKQTYSQDIRAELRQDSGSSRHDGNARVPDRKA